MAYCDTFVVVSNADTGTGTLREALTLAAANGTAVADAINFNLPDQSETGRTIVLLSELPVITSRLTIDGSTQVGAAFGISSAHVQIISSSTLQNVFWGLSILQASDVSVFGLYIRSLKPFGNQFQYSQGIAISNSTNITIGAAGKGNVICGFYNNIGINEQILGGQISYFGENLTIQANFIGVEADGLTLSVFKSRELTIGTTYGQLIIGGDELDGNLLPLGLSINQQNTIEIITPTNHLNSLPATIKIRNNKIGVSLDENERFAGSVGIRIGSGAPNGKNDIHIEDNIIVSDGWGIFVINNGYQVNIKRNYIGTNRARTKQFPMDTGIFIYWTDNVLIGGSEEDANYIGYSKPVNIWPFSKAKVSKNSFFCTVKSFPMIFNDGSGGTRTAPLISISQVSSSAVSGTATPNSTIELFYSDACGTCSPETYFGTTTTDASGNWQYNGLITGTVVASATLNNYTSEFTKVFIDVAAVRVLYTCSNTGSIKGVLPINAIGYSWYDEQDNVVGSEKDLLNMPPGKYKMKAYGGDCIAETAYFEIRRSFKVDATTAVPINSSCGSTNGSIKGISIVSNFVGLLFYSWKNTGGIEVGTAIDLVNVGAGSYSLTIRSADNSCIQTFGPFNVLNTTGPNVEQSQLFVKPSNCRTSTGAITGITTTGVGNIVYKWTNAQGVVVGNTLDLSNQPSGTYTLTISDGSSCSAITIPAIPIPEENGVVITDVGTADPATCGGANGTIKGITVSGATSYKWFNANDVFITSTNNPELINVAAGDYYLMAANNYCEKKSKVYTVLNLLNTSNYGLPQSKIENARCGLNNGLIQLSFGNIKPNRYRWVNKGDGQNVGSDSPDISGLKEGIYQLYGADANNCEKLIAEYQVERDPELLLNELSLVISADKCGLSQGGISGVTATGKIPISYEWKNDKGIIISKNAAIEGLSTGSYTLLVKDAVGCFKSATYHVGNQTMVIAKPVVTDLQVCSAGNILIQVNQIIPDHGYRLYETANGLSPIDDRTTGKFAVNIIGDRSYYISQYKGLCESGRVELKIQVGFTAVQIPNAFSPNDDGVNDYWVIKGAEVYSKMVVMIYNRNGSKVYENTSYKNDFNGIVHSRKLAVGTYYYMIYVSPNCPAIAGSLTLLR